MSKPERLITIWEWKERHEKLMAAFVEKAYNDQLTKKPVLETRLSNVDWDRLFEEFWK